MKFNGNEIINEDHIFKEISNNFTYEFWVNPTATHKVDKETVIGATGILGQKYVIGPGHGNRIDKAGLGVSVGTNGISVYEHTVNHLPATLVYKTDISTWTHIAVSYYNKIPFLYINGRFIKRGMRSLKKNVYASGLIGGLNPYGFFEGELLEVRIWDHTRSQHEIFVNMDKSLTGKEKGLIKYFNLNVKHLPINKVIYKQSSTVINDSKKLSFPRKNENPLVSIIIAVHNKWEFTKACLESIYNNTKNIEYEIIIGDDNSDDETRNIKNIFENIKLIRTGTNRGFLLNCNNAAKYASGKYLLFLNNDTIVQEDWLKYLLDLIEKDEKTGLVGSKLIYPNGKLQEAGGIIWKDASGWNFGRMDSPDKPEYSYVKEVDYISGACIMIRKSLWREIGGFDTRFSPAYFEDTDLAFEVRRLGYKVLYQPLSVVIHYEGTSHGTNVNEGIKKYQTINKGKFIEKWRGTLERDHTQNGYQVFKARDRSRKKKTILVIDHYVPQYDKDAGSRTVYQYLKLFNEMGLNVKFLGDNFFKNEPYTTELQQMGIEVLYGSWYANNISNWIKENGENIDYVFLNRPHISIKYIDIVKKHTKAKIIYYGHDLHYLRSLREYNLFKKKEMIQSFDYWKKTESDIIQKADVVYYLSDVEINEIKKNNPNITAKVIPPFFYDNFSGTNYKFSDRSDLLFVGGFSHKPNVDAVLWFVESILPKVLKEIPDIKIYVVGSNPPLEIKKLHSENIIVTDFVTDEKLIEYYRKCRLAVAPLRYGAGVKGKILEALSHKMPVITTPVGAEGYVDSNKVLTVGETPNEFAEKLKALYTDEKLLNEKSKLSLEYVKKYFSIENAKRVIKEDIQP